MFFWRARRARVCVCFLRTRCGAKHALADPHKHTRPNAPPPLPACPLYMPQEIANDVLSEQSPRRLYLVRGKLYELLANCVPPELVLRTLLLELLKKLDDELKVGGGVGVGGCGGLVVRACVL